MRKNEKLEKAIEFFLGEVNYCMNRADNSAIPDFVRGQASAYRISARHCMRLLGISEDEIQRRVPI